MFMELTMNACIGIPLYKEKLDPLEVISLNRLFEVDPKHQIYILTHRNLNLDFYKKYFLKHKNLDIIYFKADYFRSIGSYNRLLLSSFFYKKFANHEYLLIYQLDAFIFKDELDLWCSKGYDYIGAPWYDLESKFDFYQKLRKSNNLFLKWIKKNIDFNKGEKITVGNGGFSLRKIKSFINISRWLLVIEPNLLKYKINEDIVWAILVPKYFKKFKIPNKNEALHFSIESNPIEAFQETSNSLPFGCHGWNNKNFDFWKNILEKNNIEV